MTEDTAPMIKSVLEELRALRDEMRAGFAAMNERMDRIDKRLDAIERELEMTNRQLAKIVYEFGRAQVRTDMIEERVTKLEPPSGIQ